MPRRSYSRSRSRSYDRRRSRDRGERSYRGRSRSPRRDRGGPPLNSDNQVYVARFSRRTSEYDLKKAFEAYGFIEKIDLKEGRGFGFIYFENKRDAEDAIDDMNGRCLPHQDERLIVEKAGAGRKRSRRSRSRGRFGGERSNLCYNCNKDGHIARDCPNSPVRGGRERGAEGRCFICDEKGHKKIDCPQKRESRRRSRSRSRSRSPKRESRGRR